MVRNVFLETRAKALAYSRLALYTVESFPIRWGRMLVDPKSRKPVDMPADRIKNLITAFDEMLDQDINNLTEGLYSEQLIKPEPVSDHLKRYISILVDSFVSAHRKSKNQNKIFSQKAKVHLDDVPEYYRRNFHFQTDGYLSEHSAQLYSHQTEILFQGTLDLMRRVLLAPILREVKNKNKPVKILELGCGAGEVTRILAQLDHLANITAIDLSQPYIELAKKNLADNNIKFKKISAEKFKSSSKFDYVVAGYMFHELPQELRLQIIENSKKILKKRGQLIILDSIQMDDAPQFNWALKKFPQDFHEPFFANYVSHPLENMLKGQFKDVKTTKAFLSKVVIAKEPT